MKVRENCNDKLQTFRNIHLKKKREIKNQSSVGEPALCRPHNSLSGYMHPTNTVFRTLYKIMFAFVIAKFEYVMLPNIEFIAVNNSI